MYAPLIPLCPLTAPARTTQPAGLPEAPCSVNAHVDLDGLRVQITGRGLTPEEAAANFRGTLAAMQPAPAPQPPAPARSRSEQLGTLLGCWLGKASARQDWALVEKLSRGAALILAEKVQLGHRPGLIVVGSQTHDDQWYEVEGRQCSCPDYQCHARKGMMDHVCHHVAAAALWLRLA